MRDKNCVVEVGTHVAPWWLEKKSGQVYCARHRMQMEERVEEFGPYDWELRQHCFVCGGMDSEEWWKCCPKHTTEQGRDVVGECCLRALHPLTITEDTD